DACSFTIAPKDHRRTPSSAHTYRLLFVKEPSCPYHRFPSAVPPSNRCVCQQQRNEIMKLLLFCVKLFKLQLVA
ncbi:hypothetical protein, partial [Noviherbaspirillum sp. Root189]|uniref:hypothetical protein n=1 Tax=Noviherbaspirillum sp. Root189 TaxID=1736487 RepID=UPI001F3881F9